MHMENSASVDEAKPVRKKRFGVFKISPFMVIPSRRVGFALFLKQGETYVLYAEKGVLLADIHKSRLTRLGVDHLYVKVEDYAAYTSYLQENLLQLLYDEDIPVAERARVWNDAAVSLAREAFTRDLPKRTGKREFLKIKKLVNSSLKFLARADAIRELTRFIAEGEEVFLHGIGVMVMTLSVMNTYVKDEDLLVAVGMGAMFHDIGKLELPETLFFRHRESLNKEERELVESHPALGVGVCSSLPLPQETLQCILFHHERMDGSGYPSGAHGEMLPSYVKVLSLCNEYDNLIRGTSLVKKLTPFEALTRIKSRKTAHDPEMLTMLISVLSKAKLT